jgi:hypothetical protein
MGIICTTNIDAYKLKFLRTFNFVPRVGEKVRVDEVHIKEIQKLRLPTELTVIDVSYIEKGVLVELHYSKHDVERARVCDINLFP